MVLAGSGLGLAIFLISDPLHTIKPQNGIVQKVTDCNHAGFQIETYVYYHDDLISDRRTWKGNGDIDCLPLDSVNTVKERERLAAQKFLDQYKTIEP